MTAPSVAPSVGHPDFDKSGNMPVKGPSTPVPSSGTNDFEKGAGQKTVKSGGGDQTPDQAYKTERKSRSDDSYF